MTDIETHLRDMEVIFQKDVFSILSALARRRTELTSFTTLKTALNLNPNSLSRYLKKLQELGLVENYYEKQSNEKNYSFYRLTGRALKILNLQVGIPRVWELLREFKDHCKSKGWEVAEFEDWIRASNQYYNFLWTRTIHPLTFRNIVKTSKCVIREGFSYRTVDVAYTAWLFMEVVSNEFYQMIIEEPRFTASNAIYDLSQAYLTQPIVTRLNKTNSLVFREFEHFLQGRWNLKFVEAGIHILQSKNHMNSGASAKLHSSNSVEHRTAP